MILSESPTLLRCAVVHVDLFDSVVACGDTFDSTEDLEAHVLVKHRVNLYSDPPPLRFQGDLSRFRNLRITWRSSTEITAEGVDAVQDLRPNVRFLYGAGRRDDRADWTRRGRGWPVWG